ncbi:SS18-like protein 2 isoform X2 [Uloborus diversus]|uniref:SS18-like protein 2 isoform X2 n=1 Tax=Uloborus diversus TaxID=327109 RepID=UPI00240A2741|nr:SS18-like protein 2 isoform X2 [Uloborus diversus]
MSIVFLPAQKDGLSPVLGREVIGKMLDENAQLMQVIKEYQNKGRAAEVHQYMQILHRNLILLASLADVVPSSVPVLPSQVQFQQQSQVLPLNIMPNMYSSYQDQNLPLNIDQSNNFQS